MGPPEAIPAGYEDVEETKKKTKEDKHPTPRNNSYGRDGSFCPIGMHCSHRMPPFHRSPNAWRKRPPNECSLVNCGLCLVGLSSAHKLVRAQALSLLS